MHEGGDWGGSMSEHRMIASHSQVPVPRQHDPDGGRCKRIEGAGCAAHTPGWAIPQKRWLFFPIWK